MSHLALFFFGYPHIELNHNPCTLKLRKALALLAVAAISTVPITRDMLVAMLWPEVATGHSQLRYALWTLRSTLGVDWLVTDGPAVSFNPDADIMIDINQFQLLLAQAGIPGHPPDQLSERTLPLLEAAIKLYQDSFLAGFTLCNCPEFDEWQCLHTESFRRDLALALQSTVSVLTRSTQYARAISYAERWVALDPLNEPAQRSLMRLYVHTGRRAEAIRQFRACTRYLQEELDMQPGQQTKRLYQDILTRRFPSATPTA